MKGSCNSVKGALDIFSRNFVFTPWAYRETTSILKNDMIDSLFWKSNIRVAEEPEGEIPEQRNRQASCDRS